MNYEYISVTPVLKERWKEYSSSNASDFIRFEENYYSVMAMSGERPVGLVVAKKHSLASPLEMLREAFIDIIDVLAARNWHRSGRKCDWLGKGEPGGPGPRLERRNPV